MTAIYLSLKVLSVAGMLPSIIHVLIAIIYLSLKVLSVPGLCGEL